MVDSVSELRRLAEEFIAAREAFVNAPIDDDRTYRALFMARNIARSALHQALTPEVVIALCEAAEALEFWAQAPVRTKTIGIWPNVTNELDERPEDRRLALALTAIQAAFTETSNGE